MVFAFYNRLSRARQKTYRASDALTSLALPAHAELATWVARIEAELTQDRRAEVQAACQALLDILARGYGVPRVKVKVHAARPAHDWGELHGLYEPQEAGEAIISVWMRTAARKQVVAFRTFLRTLIHELCHHLDYELFELEETFHTEGFYKREASLVRQLLAVSGRPEPIAAAVEPEPGLPNGVSSEEMFAKLKAIVAKGKA